MPSLADSISRPVGLGSLGTDRVVQFDIELAQRHRPVHTRQSVIEPESLNICQQRLSKIRESFFFRIALAVCRDIGHSGCAPPTPDRESFPQ
jgi:hypothetical protein